MNDLKIQGQQIKLMTTGTIHTWVCHGDLDMDQLLEAHAVLCDRGFFDCPRVGWEYCLGKQNARQKAEDEAIAAINAAYNDTFVTRNPIWIGV